MVVDGGGGCTFWLLLLLLLLLLVLVLWLLLLCWLLGGRRWRGWQLLEVVEMVGLMGRRSRSTFVRGRRHQRSRLSACCRRLLLPQLPADHGSAIHVRVLRGATAEEERGPRRGPTAAAATAAGPHRRRDARHCADGDANSNQRFSAAGVAAERARAQIGKLDCRQTCAADLRQ